MTVPVDLVAPGTLQDPVEEFFRQGGIDVPEPDQTEGITKKQVALIATALAASFLVFRMLMHKELDQSIAPSSKGAAQKLIERSFFKIAPLWARAALPAAIAAYRLGSYDAATISADELETLAQAYVKSLGEYIHTTSAEAMLDGFQAQLNAKWSNELAWQRSVAGYGLDGPGTRTYIQSFTAGVKDGYIVDPVPQMSVKMAQKGLGVRAKRFGDTEAWSAVQTGRNVVWMAQAVSGDLPEGTKKRWVTASDERVCPVCGPLDQRVIGLTQRFHSVDGRKFYAPGVHPNCRCRLELVYPDGYINRVEELVRKNRPGDPYNRDNDGHFASQESRGWTYRQAMDDSETHTSAPRRVRLRELAPEEVRPKQRTMVDTEQETKTEQKSIFGTESSIFSSPTTQSSVFGAPSIFGAPARTQARATAPAPVATTTIYVMRQGVRTPVEIVTPPPTENNPNPLPEAEPLGPMIFSHDAAMANDLHISRDGRRVPMYDYDPELGDTLTFEQGWADEDAPLFDFGIDGLPDMSQQEENALYEEHRRFGANARDERSTDPQEYWSALDEGYSLDEGSREGNVIIIYTIKDAVGYAAEDVYVPTGSYKVVDVEDVEPKKRERTDYGVIVRKNVTLEYINHNPA